MFTSSRPRLIEATIGHHKKLLTVTVPYQYKGICSAIPDYRKWNPALKCWVCRPSFANIEYLQQVLRGAKWTDEALALAEAAIAVRENAEKLRAQREALNSVDDPIVLDYKWDGVVQPWAHQKKVFLLSRDEPAYALLMEQGTGKTKVIVDTAAWNFLHDRIDALFIVAPNGVKAVWEEELEDHLPKHLTYEFRLWDSKLGKHALEELRHWRSSKTPALKVFAMNEEAFSSKRGHEWAKDFVASNRCMMTVDESTSIKSPGAKRTRAIVALGKKCVLRRILTGTPVTKGPLDVFSQFMFLDPNILGFGSFYAFRNRFALMGGYEGREVLGYANLDHLQELIASYSYRVLADECQDLPPKRYQKIEVDATAAQQKLYRTMAKDMIADHEGHKVSVTLAMTQMMRLQQILGGFLPVLDEDKSDHKNVYRPVAIPGKNPKLDTLEAQIENLDPDRKVIIWSRFRPELEAIQRRLEETYGPDTVAPFHGGIEDKRRTALRREFADRKNRTRRFFVGNQATGGKGLDLTAASITYYVSNSFDLEHRLQSEKRPHRPGADDDQCLFVDIVGRNSVETKTILPSLRDKKNVADFVTGDAFSEWI